MAERHEQHDLMAWIYRHEEEFPDLRLAFHPMNEGRRHPAKARSQGIRAGVPDLMLPAPSADRRFLGCAVELKWRYGQPSATQLWWLSELSQRGWRCELVRCKQAGDWAMAAQVIADHLGLPDRCRDWR